MINVEKLEIKKPEIKTAVSVVITEDSVISSTTETSVTHCSGVGQNPLLDKQSEDN